MLRSLVHLTRLGRAGLTLARHGALVPAAARTRLPRFARGLLPEAADPDAEASGARLAAALEDLGPTYIKLGQALATRPDLVGPGAAKGLARLHDRLPAFPMGEAHAAIRAEFESGVDELFSDFGPAVAAASIAQVHRAVTRSQGEADPPRAVAVKILRPGIEAAFTREVDSLLTAARLAETLRPSLRRLKPRENTEIFAQAVAQEMDLRLEAAAAGEMAETTADDPDFRVPAVDWRRTSRRVLTTEWIDGIPLADHAALTEAGHDLERLGRIVLQSFLRQALGAGLFHADLHPGNLFVDDEGRLVAVDFGIVGRLDRQTRAVMAEILHGFITRDYPRVAEAHFDAGYVPRSQDRQAFTLALRAIGEPIWGRPAHEMSMARLLTQLFDTTRQFDMEARPELILLQKTMVMAEGVARSLDPNISIWEVGQPVLEDWMRSEMGPEARLRDAADAARGLGRLAAHAPDFAEEARGAAQGLALIAREGGLPLSAQARSALGARSTWRGPLLWALVGAIVGAVIAAAVL